MADYLTEVDTPPLAILDKKSKAQSKPMGHKEKTLTLYTDNTSCKQDSGVGLVLINLLGHNFTYSRNFNFHASNNDS